MESGISQLPRGGGVATTALHHFFGAPKEYKHCPKPPLDPRISKAIFIMGDPAVQIQSIFNRYPDPKNGWAPHHCKSLGGDDKKIYRYLNLSDYLENAEDLFQLERQFDNWTGNSSHTHYPILLVKYDSIWENLPAIFEFLNRDPQLIDQFPAKRERSTYPPLSVRDKENMEKIYGRLQEKYVSAPEIFIRPGP